MDDHSGATAPIWVQVPPLPARATLSEDIQTDVCVVGAGITGLSTAYFLAREGRRVVVIDDGPLAGGETARTTAHLTHVVDDRYHRIEHVHGEEGARIVAESHTAAIDRIESVIRSELIACDFTRLDAYLFVPAGDPDDELEREFQAARRAGIESVEWADRAPIHPFHTGRCLRFPNQGQFHPLRYLDALARAIERDGGRLYRDTHAIQISDGYPARVDTAVGPSITASDVVIATNAPVHTTLRIHSKQVPYRSYVIAADVRAGSVTRALYYDTPSPHHDVRLHAMESDGQTKELLIVGGEDHETGHVEDATARWSQLESWMRERFPTAGEVAYRWSGQVLEPVDGIAFIGLDHEASHLYLATGASGTGITHGTMAGMIIADLIGGRSNPWAALYNPARKRPKVAA